MSIPVSPAALTISDTKPNSFAAFPLFILLIDLLIVPLRIKRGAPLIESIWDKLLLSHSNSMFKSFSL